MGDNTQKLCSRGATTLQTKSQTVEEAANELINMLCDVESACQEEEAKEEEEDDQGFDEEEGEEGAESARNEATGGSATARSNAESRKSRPVSSKQNAIAKKKKEMRENIEESAMDLLTHFINRNLDALLKATRNTLEALRKRITSSSMAHYIGDSSQKK